MLTGPQTGNRVGSAEMVFKSLVILGSLFLMREIPKNGLEAWPGWVYCRVYCGPVLRAHFVDPSNISISKVLFLLG